MDYGELLENIKPEGDNEISDVLRLISPRNDAEFAQLLRKAMEVRAKNFGNRAYLYGFVYFTTYCRNSCSFCLYKHGNSNAIRYRKSPEEVVSLAMDLKDQGVDLVDLTMGEDPLYHSESGREDLVRLVRSVEMAADLPIMVSPGVLPRSTIKELATYADWIACYQETHNKTLFKGLRPRQNYDMRMKQKIWGKEAGMLSEEGVMIGIGESLEDLANSIQVMGALKMDQVRAMSYVPQPGSDLASSTADPRRMELIIIAAMRVLFPDRLIPASLDIEGLGGLRSRFAAGANVVTSIIPVSSGLAGVAQHELDIENGMRSVREVRSMLGDMGFSVAGRADYTRWLDRRKGGCAQ